MKNSIIRKALADGMRIIADQIEHGKCRRSEEDLEVILDTFITIEMDRTAGAKLLGISVSYFDKLRKTDPLFPKPYKRAGYKPLWSRSDLKAYKIPTG